MPQCHFRVLIFFSSYRFEFRYPRVEPFSPWLALSMHRLLPPYKYRNRHSWCARLVF